jgi:hypothetical protein
MGRRAGSTNTVISTSRRSFACGDGTLAAMLLIPGLVVNDFGEVFRYALAALRNCTKKAVFGLLLLLVLAD